MLRPQPLELRPGGTSLRRGTSLPSNPALPDSAAAGEGRPRCSRRGNHCLGAPPASPGERRAQSRDPRARGAPGGNRSGRALHRPTSGRSAFRVSPPERGEEATTRRQRKARRRLGRGGRGTHRLWLAALGRPGTVHSGRNRARIRAGSTGWARGSVRGGQCEACTRFTRFPRGGARRGGARLWAGLSPKRAVRGAREAPQGRGLSVGRGPPAGGRGARPREGSRGSVPRRGERDDREAPPTGWGG